VTTKGAKICGVVHGRQPGQQEVERESKIDTRDCKSAKPKAR